MSSWLIAAMGLVYGFVAVEQCWHGRWGLAIMFLGYTIGNVGLYVEATR